MDYAWVSSVIVLVILAILVIGWLPRQTVDSMKRVVEHRADKYSLSLHLVDAQSGTRFSDDHHALSEGVVMRSKQAGGAAKAAADKEAKRVAHIRRLRREAARRRAIIAVTLLVVTIVVAVAAIPLHFSGFFALIPLALLAVVLVLGVRASNHAREWERQLKVKRHRQAMDAADRGVETAKRIGQLKAAHQSAELVDVSVTNNGDDEPTGVMEQREIRQALRASRADHERVEALRAQHEREHQEVAASAERQPDGVAAKASNEVGTKSGAKQAVKAHSAVAASASASSKTGAKSVDASKINRVQGKAAVSKASQSHKTNETGNQAQIKVKSVVRTQSEPNDATNELKQVHPVRALDAVDMVSNQDLISFSLGAPRSGVDVQTSEPRSLEIKSTKQVAKAVPQIDEKPASDTAAAVKSDGDKISDKVPDTDTKAKSKQAKSDETEVESFHDAEVSADVEVPTSSSDSLGAGLEKILARRSA